MKLMRLNRRRTQVVTSAAKLPPPVSIFSVEMVLNNGEKTSLSKWQGKKMLLVNTASDCGYTGQYAELQELYRRYADKLVVIGFPSNDFKEQEKGSDAEIAAFCEVNYGVTFPLAKKSAVKGTDRNPVFRWLCDSTQNGWNNHEPSWNFSKYLVREDGVLLQYFDPAISPLSNEVIAAIENNTR